MTQNDTKWRKVIKNDAKSFQKSSHFDDETVCKIQVGNKTKFCACSIFAPTKDKSKSTQKNVGPIL
jgi:hypothetical protein